MSIQSTNPRRQEQGRPTVSSRPTSVAVSPRKPTTVAPYDLVPSESDVARTAVKEQVTLSDKQLLRIRNADHIVSTGVQQQRACLKEISQLHRQLKKQGPIEPPAPPQRNGVVKWLCSFFTRDTRSKIDADISRKVAEVRAKQTESVKKTMSDGREITTSISREETNIRKSFGGQTFELKKDTPEILRQVSMPADKKFVSFDELKKSVEAAARNSGGSVKLHMPSQDRIVIYRQRPDKSWESLELYWRSVTQVRFVRNGEPIGNLFNCDASVYAARFASFTEPPLKRRANKEGHIAKPGEVWKIVDLAQASAKPEAPRKPQMAAGRK